MRMLQQQAQTHTMTCRCMQTQSSVDNSKKKKTRGLTFPECIQRSKLTKAERPELASAQHQLPSRSDKQLNGLPLVKTVAMYGIVLVGPVITKVASRSILGHWRLSYE